jgi:O-methyltransferase domain/Dimerisation domain
MTHAADTPATTLLRLTTGYQISQAIHVAAELRLADLIGDEPVSAEAIAPRVGAHVGSLYRLLRALSTVAIFRETDDRSFVGSPMSDLLRTDHPRSMWGWAALIGRPYQREIWGDLLHSVRTGEDAPHHLYKMDLWEYRADKPEETTIFNAAMSAGSRNVAPAIIAAYDFARFARIVDVGGANGAFLAAILTASPRSTGVVFDLPHVVREAAAVIRAAGLEGRCETAEGSYFNAVPPGGDAYILKSVLMDATDEEAGTILQNVRTAMGARGTLLVIEGLIGAPNEGQQDAFFDLTMLVATGGSVRTKDEWAAVFAAGGFTLDCIKPTASRFHVLEGHPSA